jgi:hypothetical protein
MAATVLSTLVFTISILDRCTALNPSCPYSLRVEIIAKVILPA